MLTGDQQKQVYLAENLHLILIVRARTETTRPTPPGEGLEASAVAEGYMRPIGSILPRAASRSKHPAPRKAAVPRSRQDEYRVCYMRSNWAHSKSQRFARERDARAFLEKLHGGGRPDLQPFLYCTLEHREVLASKWTEVRP